LKYYRLIAPDWLKAKHPDLPKVLEGMFSDEDIKELNQSGYNIYYFPNHPKDYPMEGSVSGNQIDTFEYVFVDYDCKSGTYESKEEFIRVAMSTLMPTKVVDSGNGVHVYWRVTDLDVKSYQRLTRRMMRLLKTDDATCMICQLMRYPCTLNTKLEDNFVPCVYKVKTGSSYTSEELDKLLPAITAEDEEFCKQHYDRTYNIQSDIKINEELPAKFGKLLKTNHEVAELFTGETDDRSKNDFRLGHIMYASGFTKDEALSVLINTAKAMSRAPIHRTNYARNIVDKIWTYEGDEHTDSPQLSSSVEDILKRSGDTLKGIAFRSHKRIDNTVHGFRLQQVIGLVAGSGVGKTAFALNMFLWSSEQNPDYHMFFVPLEQPAREIADRIKTMTKGNPALYKKIHILSNYDDEGNFRNLSLDEIREYISDWEKKTGFKVGQVCIDHIGALKKKGVDNENQDLMTIMHSMKSFAVALNVQLIMQSQSSREKAGIGDLELNKDAAYGSVFFEAYCDFLITLWQPLKRCHNEEACPTVTAFKFCKIRHKKAKQDVIKEDVPYYFSFDSETELMEDMTQDQITSFNYFVTKATNKRKADRKTELIAYTSVPYNEETKLAATVSSSRVSTRH
jgi:hypothetical protein